MNLHSSVPSRLAKRAYALRKRFSALSRQSVSLPKRDGQADTMHANSLLARARAGYSLASVL